jgi:acyl carrier protein
MSVKDLKSVKNNIRRLLAEALGVLASEISESKTFFGLGLTSRIGVMWMAQVNEAYELTIPAVRVYNYPTLERMAELVHEELTVQGRKNDTQRQVRPMFGRRAKAQDVSAAPGSNTAPRLDPVPPSQPLTEAVIEETFRIKSTLPVLPVETLEDTIVDDITFSAQDRPHAGHGAGRISLFVSSSWFEAA